MVAKFLALRYLILVLVRTTWRQQIKARAQLTQKQQRLFRRFLDGRPDVKHLECYLRSQVYALLHDHIFSSRHYALGKEIASIDGSLEKIESIMWEKLPECNDRPIRQPYAFEAKLMFQ